MPNDEPESTSPVPADAGLPSVDGQRLRLWNALMDDAAAFLKAGQFRKARQKLKAALREARHFGEDDKRLAQTLGNLVSIECMTKDDEMSPEQASALADEAMEMHRKCYGESDELASCQIRAAVMLENKKQYRAADAIVAQAIAILRDLQQRPDSPHDKVAMHLCEGLFNRASMLALHKDLNADVSLVSSLINEAYEIGQRIYDSKDALFVHIANLRARVSSMRK